jgi:hypothetical protein
MHGFKNRIIKKLLITGFANIDKTTRISVKKSILALDRIRNNKSVRLTIYQVGFDDLSSDFVGKSVLSDGGEEVGLERPRQRRRRKRRALRSN